MEQIKSSNIQFRKGKNRLFFYIVCTLTGITMIPLFLIIFELLKKGYKQFLSLDFITEVAPTSLEAMVAKLNNELIPGGILNGLTGTLLILFIAAIIAFPIGLFTGIYLSEHKNRFANLIRTLADLLQGMPSIVVGVITYMWVVRPMHSYSALAGSITLAIMMLPMIIRSTEESMRMLPTSLKEAGLALGGSYTSVIMRVLVPSAFGGLFTGSLLALSRVMGETAPLLVTVLGASIVSWDISQPISAMPLLIWEFYNDPNLLDLVWSTSLMLLLIVLSLNLISKHIAKKWQIQ